MTDIRIKGLSEAEFIAVIDHFAAEVARQAQSKGWTHGEAPASFLPEDCANIHGEISELWEAYRRNELAAPCDKAMAMEAAGIEPLTCAEEELADIVLRALHASQKLKIDIGRAILTKHRFNATRPYRHGGKQA